MSSFPYRIKVNSSVISQEVLLGETILMNVDTLAYFGLDELGSKIWRQLNQCSDAQEAFDRISAESELDDEQLSRIFRGILQGLEKSGIVTVDPTFQ